MRQADTGRKIIEISWSYKIISENGSQKVYINDINSQEWDKEVEHHKQADTQSKICNLADWLIWDATAWYILLFQKEKPMIHQIFWERKSRETLW